MTQKREEMDGLTGTECWLVVWPSEWLSAECEASSSDYGASNGGGRMREKGDGSGVVVCKRRLASDWLNDRHCVSGTTTTTTGGDLCIPSHCG